MKPTRHSQTTFRTNNGLEQEYDHHRIQATTRHTPTVSDQAAFTQAELHEAQGKLKEHKATGPDEILNELFKLLDHNAEQILLKAFNDIWETGYIPDKWKEATVVSLYKGKRAETDPAN